MDLEGNRDVKYKASKGEDKHMINIGNITCNYRAWQLTGIPYPYSICVI